MRGEDKEDKAGGLEPRQQLGKADYLGVTG